MNRLGSAWKAGGRDGGAAGDGTLRPMSRRRRLMHFALLYALMMYAGFYLGQGRHLFDFIEDRVYALYMRMYADHNYRLAEEARDKIKVVTISDDTYASPEFASLHGEPLPRAKQAEVLSALARCGASVVAYDIVFDAPSNDDAVFANAARAMGRVVWGCEWKETDPPQLVLPQACLLAASPYAGHARAPQSETDPWILRCEPSLSAGGITEPAFSLAVVRLYRHAIGAAPLPDPPLDGDGTFRINYFCSIGKLPGPAVPHFSSVGAGGSSAVEASAPANSFSQFDFNYVLGMTPQPTSFDQQNFKNKIVLVGDTTTLNHDTHSTPAGAMPGVDVQANAIATLLMGAYIRVAPPWMVSLCGALLCAVCGLLAALLAPRLASAMVLATLCLFVLGTMAVYVLYGLSLPVTQPTLSALVFVLAVVLDRSVSDQYDKRRMRGVLEQYVSPQVMQEGAPTGDVTLVFTDLEGSSELSERLGATFERARNTHFDLLRMAARSWNGFEVETAGDSCFVVFARSSDAVRFAVDAQHAINGQRWPDSIGQLRVRIGMHTGAPFVAQDRTRLTYRGPATNRAARVMGAGQGGQILLSSDTMAALEAESGQLFQIVDFGLHRLKGIGEVNLYEVSYASTALLSSPVSAGHPARPAGELSAELTEFLEEGRG